MASGKRTPASTKPRKPKSAPKRGATRRPAPSVRGAGLGVQVAEIVAALEKVSDARIRDNMGPRFGVYTDRALGVRAASIRAIARRVKLRSRGDEAAQKRNHDLAMALWDDGLYEARTVAAFVDEPNQVTRRQMNAWAGDFDNWAICDTVCFHLFDKTPLAWDKARDWSSSPREFVKRAAFAMVASIALHDKCAADDQFVAFLPLIVHGAEDNRNFVKKGVSWALRGIGNRNRALHEAALACATKLAESSCASARWVGRDALRDLTRPTVAKRLLRKAEAKRRSSARSDRL